MRVIFSIIQSLSYFLSSFSLIHLFQTDGCFTSVLSLKFNRRYLYRDNDVPLINLPSKLDSHSPQEIQPLIRDFFLWYHIGIYKFLTVHVFEHFLICSFCLRTHQIALSCVYTAFLTILSCSFASIFFFFCLIKIFKRHYLNFLKSLSQGTLYTHTTLSSIAFTQRYLYLCFSLKLYDFFFSELYCPAVYQCLPKHKHQTTGYCYWFSCIIC